MNDDSDSDSFYKIFNNSKVENIFRDEFCCPAVNLTSLFCVDLMFSFVVIQSSELSNHHHHRFRRLSVE
jgi:hypothetical protein